MTKVQIVCIIESMHFKRTHVHICMLTCTRGHHWNKHLNWEFLGFPTNIKNYGNTTAASIPIAMCDAREKGLFSSDDIIILAAFGAGFTWASAAIRW